MWQKELSLELDQFRFCYLLGLSHILNRSELVSYLQTGITLLQKDAVKLSDTYKSHIYFQTVRTRPVNVK